MDSQKNDTVTSNPKDQHSSEPSKPIEKNKQAPEQFEPKGTKHGVDVCCGSCGGQFYK